MLTTLTGSTQSFLHFSSCFLLFFSILKWSKIIALKECHLSPVSSLYSHAHHQLSTFVCFEVINSFREMITLLLLCLFLLNSSSSSTYSYDTPTDAAPGTLQGYTPLQSYFHMFYAWLHLNSAFSVTPIYQIWSAVTNVTSAPLREATPPRQPYTTTQPPCWARASPLTPPWRPVLSCPVPSPVSWLWMSMRLRLVWLSLLLNPTTSLLPSGTLALLRKTGSVGNFILVVVDNSCPLKIASLCKLIFISFSTTFTTIN